VGGLTGRFAAAPAVRDVLRVGLRVVLGGEEVREAVRRRFDEKDLRARRDGVSPLDVQRDLEGPALVGARVARAAGLIDLLEAAVRGRAGRKAEGAAEHGE